MAARESEDVQFTLVTVDGPQRLALSLSPPGPRVIGRNPDCALCLLDDPRVSREHARLVYKASPAGEPPWRICDAGSRHGTWLNGVRLVAGAEMPLRENDLIGIVPWTFRVTTTAVGGSADATGAAIDTLDDEATISLQVSTLDVRDAGVLAQQRLSALLDCAAAIHAAEDEATFGSAVLEAAVAGTGFANAALLRPMDAGGRVEVIAHHGAMLDAAGGPLLSRTLIRRAADGRPARLAGLSDVAAASVMQLQIAEALCLPILLGDCVEGFLYLDNRGAAGGRGRLASDANAFAIGLARLVAMAMANLRRLEVERRHAAIETELAAAAEAQRRVLPPREGRFGRVSYLGESKPGRYVGGDFFDVLPLDGDRVAVALGDVAGKGIPAAVLMTASHGYLHALLREHGDLGRAVAELNRFVCQRYPDGKFLSLWVGVVDPAAGRLSCVDAGHGYVLARRSDGGYEPLPEELSVVLGFDAEMEYASQTMALPAGGGLLIVSDGIVEQTALPGETQRARPRAFGLDGVVAAMQPKAGILSTADAITSLFAAVAQHAGTTALADDATAVLVRW